ncbi:cold-shock protein [Streptomyces sp. Ru87]|nr:cold-shock protein [Streptomyces sp. Ru87]
MKFYDSERGRGLLVPDGGGQELVVDSRALQAGGALEEGQRVSYELMRDSAEDLRAINVVPLRADGSDLAGGHGRDLL